MSKERFIERQNQVSEAFTRLQEAVASPESEMVRDATIQRFEFTFEIVWKTLKLYLERQGLECGGPRSTLKSAFVDGLIRDPAEADVWFRMLDDRSLAKHAHDQDLAFRIYRSVIDDYSPLLTEMAGRVLALEWD